MNEVRDDMGRAEAKAEAKDGKQEVRARRELDFNYLQRKSRLHTRPPSHSPRVHKRARRSIVRADRNIIFAYNRSEREIGCS